MARGMQILSGIGIGLLTGLIIGLSISQVVGIVLGALTALLSIYFGLQAGATVQPKYGLMAAFSISCILGVLSGLYMRTHSSLSPSIKDQLRNWTDASYSTDEAKQIVLAETIGVSIVKGSGDTGLQLRKLDNTIASRQQILSALMAANTGENGFICDHFVSFSGLKSAFQNGDTIYRKLLETVCTSTTDTSLQWAKLKAIQTILCDN